MWLAPPDPLPLPQHAAPPAHVAIAIPARNEEGAITSCLGAIDRSAAAAARSLASLRVVVVANNCTDATAAVAAAFAARHFRLVVADVQLPAAQAHAGGARRLALDRAAGLLPGKGILATTDADSRVAGDWLVRLLGEFALGVDAVAGAITLDAAERRRLPPLPGRDAEWRLAQGLARLEALLDPCDHDPMPRHIWAWGANLAVTLAAYRQVGGMPEVPLAEDRALAERLLAQDLKLRRSTGPLVYTSARTCGRAPGGFADLIQGFASDREQPCDAALEPVADCIRRLRWRARLRAVHRAGGRGAVIAAAPALLADAAGLPETPWFGALWAAIEQRSPLLQRRRLDPARLPRELRRLDRAIAVVSGNAADRGGIRSGAAAG